jgi:lysophospholipase
VRIRAAVWNADAPNGTVFLLNGRTEYIEKYGRPAAEMAQRGFASVTLDWRGQGLSDRALPDRLAGHVDDFAEFQADLDLVLAHARASGLPEPYYMISHSMGGCIALRAIVRGLPFQAAAFSAPMWGLLISAWQRPFAMALASASRWFSFDGRYAPGTGAKTYVLDQPYLGNFLTTDAEMWDYMRKQALAQPDLVLGGPSLGWLKAALSECHALMMLPSPPVAAYVALGTQEKIVDTGPVHGRMALWRNGKLDLYQGAEHEILMERPALRTRFFDAASDLFKTHR